MKRLLIILAVLAMLILGLAAQAECPLPQHEQCIIGGNDWEFNAESADYPHYLLRLAELELLDRERRATERRIHQARFPVVKSLDTFEFMAIPTVNKALVLELARCEFLLRRENVLLLGNSDPDTYCLTSLTC
jgi:DNA replication protein DnaC